LGVTAHLLPFGTEATPVADYKGLAELMIASGAVKNVETHVVYDGDEFTYQFGLDPKLVHVPASPRKKGAQITYAYCILHLPFARFAFDVMCAADIEEIRQKYSKQWKNGPLPAWYAKKTVVRQVAKLVPRNPRLAKMLSVLEQERDVEFDAVPDAKRIEALRDEDEITVPREPGDEESTDFEPPY
jgi:recombination protein RecT